MKTEKINLGVYLCYLRNQKQYRQPHYKPERVGETIIVDLLRIARRIQSRENRLIKHRESNKRYVERNKEKVRKGKIEYFKNRYHNDPVFKKMIDDRKKEWTKKNPERYKEYHKNYNKQYNTRGVADA
jgi:hypothetical protein